MVGVMDIGPGFTIFTDIVGWAQAMGEKKAQWEIHEVGNYETTLLYLLYYQLGSNLSMLSNRAMY